MGFQSKFKRLKTQKIAASTATRSVISNEFSQDHELVQMIFEDLKTDKENKNYKGIAKSLVGLVDLLRDMTLHKDQYETYDAS